VLEQTIESMSNAAEKRKELKKLLPGITKETENMSVTEVNTLYKKYCDYVDESLKRGSGGTITSKQVKLLKSLYSEETLKNMPVQYRKALIIQERVRSIVDKPTWLR